MGIGLDWIVVSGKGGKGGLGSCWWPLARCVSCEESGIVMTYDDTLRPCWRQFFIVLDGGA